ncbi:MAG: gamma-glutamyl-gamma-aminobutyrate hydrolase family protein [Rickettsiales bacterium]|nr:gamma-glutamyl-gamma-aminobutyrate hydrolase family protein [Rickettsiales bacterium]
MTTKPIIGVILDWEDKGSFSKHPYFAIREHYINAVRYAGGTPILIPYGDQESITSYLDQIDGLLVPGGFYALPETWYEDKTNTSPYEATPRFKFEEAIINQAFKLDMPILAICAGMQVIAGMHGGKLTSNIANHNNGVIDHFDTKTSHIINVTPDSLLFKITKQSSFQTNTHHQEAVISTSNKVTISGICSDGIIEAIEIKDRKFVLGLQWHPEMLCHHIDQITNQNPHHLIFKEFINAAQN